MRIDEILIVFARSLLFILERMPVHRGDFELDVRKQELRKVLGHCEENAKREFCLRCSGELTPDQAAGDAPHECYFPVRP